MTRFAAIAVLLLAQDGAPRDPVDCITPKNSRSSFDAISKIVDLPRSEAEAAAAKLPAVCDFYRRMILDDVAMRAQMGERFGREVRVTLDYKDAHATTVLASIAKQSGIRINDTADLFEDFDEEPKISLQVRDMLFFEAVDAVCRLAKVQSWRVLLSNEVDFDELGDATASCYYRDFMFTAGTMERRWAVEFGAGSRQWMSVRVAAIWDPRSGILGAGAWELIEGCDDRATKFATQKLPEETPAATTDATEEEVRNLCSPLQLDRLSTLTLTSPHPEATKIERLRGSFTARMPLDSSDFTFTPTKDIDEKSDDHFDVRVEWKAKESEWVEVSIKPKGAKAEFLKMPVQLVMRIKTVDFDFIEGDAELRDGVAVYTPQAYSSIEDIPTPDEPQVESLVVRIHRKTLDRRVRFEFTDIPLK